MKEPLPLLPQSSAARRSSNRSSKKKTRPHAALVPAFPLTWAGEATARRATAARTAKVASKKRGMVAKEKERDGKEVFFFFFERGRDG